MKLLIWCPFVNLGGGIRLLSQLVPAIAAHPEIEHIRFALPSRVARNTDLRAKLGAKVQIAEIGETFIQRTLEYEPSQERFPGHLKLQSFLNRQFLGKHLDRVYSRIIREMASDCDLVYVFWPHQAAYYPTGKPVVCTYQDMIFLEFPEILGGAASVQEEERTREWVKNATIVVSSTVVRAKLARRFDTSMAQSPVIYHNIAPADWRDTATDPILQQVPPRYFIYPANINVHKNHDTLLKAWAKFEKRAEFPLVLVGESIHILDKNWSIERNTYWQQDRLVGLVRRLGLQAEHDFFAFGYVSDDALKALMKNATGLIMPSLAEGGGSYPVEEALNMGIPVLCSDIPVMREHLSQRSARIGWFDPDSPESILRAVHDLMAEYDAYKQSALDGMHDPRPTWEQVGAQYVEVFRNVLHKRS